MPINFGCGVHQIGGVLCYCPKIGFLLNGVLVVVVSLQTAVLIWFGDILQKACVLASWQNKTKSPR